MFQRMYFTNVLQYFTALIGHVLREVTCCMPFIYLFVSIDVSVRLAFCLSD